MTGESTVARGTRRDCGHRARAALLLAGAALIALPAAGRVAATGDDDSDRVYQLGEVVVSATSAAGVESIGTVRTLGRADLEAGGAVTLDEALALVPGLQVRTGGAGTPRIDIRGLRTRHVLLLLDGIPISDSYDGQFDPTTVPVEHIERIKITTGGGSLLYGPGGNGGVINIITRAGVRELEGSLATGVREGDAYRGELAVSAGTERWRFFAAGSSQSRDGYPLPSSFDATAAENGGTRDNSDEKRRNLFASARYEHSERTRAGLSFNRIDGEHGVPPVTNYDKNDPFANKAKYDRQDDVSGYGLQAAVDHQINTRLGLTGWAYLNRLDTEDNRYDDATYSAQAANGASRTAASTSIAGTSLQLKRRTTATGLATVGLLAESHGWDADGFQVSKNGAKSFDESRDPRLFSAALQYEAWPALGLAMTASAGYSRQDRDDAAGDGDFTGLVGASYQASPATRVKASWARKVRFPSIRQLYDTSSGNPGLEAERTTHYEMGVQQQLGASTMVTADLFRIDADGFIEKDGDAPYLNYEELRLQGVEVAGETRVRGNAVVRASYAFLRSEDRSPGSEREELQYRPRHTVGLESSYRFAFGLAPHLSVIHVAGQYTYDNDKQPPLQKRRIDDYTVVDLRLRQELAADRVALHVGIANLLDTEYEQSYGLPRPGRTLSAGLRCGF